MPVFSELLLIMSLKEVKRLLRDSMKSASPLFSYSLGERQRQRERQREGEERDIEERERDRERGRRET